MLLLSPILSPSSKFPLPLIALWRRYRALPWKRDKKRESASFLSSGERKFEFKSAGMLPILRRTATAGGSGAVFVDRERLKKSQCRSDAKMPAYLLCHAYQHSVNMKNKIKNSECSSHERKLTNFNLRPHARRLITKSSRNQSIGSKSLASQALMPDILTAGKTTCETNWVQGDPKSHISRRSCPCNRDFHLKTSKRCEGF